MGENQHYWLLEKWLQEEYGPELYRRLSRMWRNPMPGVELSGLEDWVGEELGRMVRHVAETAMFTTENGYIGSSSSASVAEGDVVCLLLGSKLPAILRPQGDKYQLISFAYVHGIMNGKFVEESARTGRGIEQFCIV